MAEAVEVEEEVEDKSSWACRMDHSKSKEMPNEHFSSLDLLPKVRSRPMAIASNSKTIRSMRWTKRRNQSERAARRRSSIVCVSWRFSRE